MKTTGILKGEIKALAPSYFALVMSTGVISIASHLLHYDLISNFLFWVNNIQFAILILLLLLRIVLFFPDVITDLSTHANGAGFLTLVAASSILGLQFALLKQNYQIAIILWFFALFLWIVLMYSFFVLVVIKEKKPSLEEGLNGSWLLLAVSTQSLSILAGTLVEHLPFPVEVTAFFSLSTFLLGFMLYIMMITLIFYRLLFSPLKAEEFTPPYWIDMGAAAITTLAGATLAKTLNDIVIFNDLIPFMKAISILSWAISTWWIPIVFILEIWRHVSKKFPVNYNASYWSMIFPLGMYTICTWRTSEALNFPHLEAIAQVFIVIAWAAWLITFIGMCYNILKMFLSDIEIKQE